jgi:hypothetical protein
MSEKRMKLMGVTWAPASITAVTGNHHNESESMRDRKPSFPAVFEEERRSEPKTEHTFTVVNT